MRQQTKQILAGQYSINSSDGHHSINPEQLRHYDLVKEAQEEAEQRRLQGLRRDTNLYYRR